MNATDSESAKYPDHLARPKKSASILVSQEDIFPTLAYCKGEGLKFRRLRFRV